jgi:protocatechuate 3,4-dioxygenase beta subunit
MSTFTIRVTSSATNSAGTAYGQQPDLGAPSFFDMVVTNSTDPQIPNGIYDAYCLNPLIDITLSPTSYLAQSLAGNPEVFDVEYFSPIGFSSLTQVQVDQLNWLLSQNFTSDPKYLGQFNYGEVQTAIWKIVGYTDAQIGSAGLTLFLNDNNRNVVSAADINFLISSAQSAVASGVDLLPANAYFSAVIDPAGNVQPLIVQLQNAKLGNYVWLDADTDGIQDANETGVDNVIVELYDGNGVFITSTLTGDDFSTAAVEHGYYQFAGLAAGNYQVKFVAPTYNFTAQDANGNSQDAADSDANTATGFSQVVTLAAGGSNQTIDAGLVQLASLGDRLWIDSNGNGQQDDGATGIAGRTVTLIGGGADGVIGTGGDDTSATTVTGADGYYNFSGLNVGEEYQVQFGDIPSGMVFTGQNIGADVSDSDADTTTGKTQIVTLASGEHNPTLDAGVYAPVAIGDKVWEDKNADGKQDGNEPGIDGVTVRLYNCVTNQLVATTVTANGGTYLFDGLAPGTYHVVFETPNGFVETTANVGGDAGDSDAVGGVTGCYTLPSGTTDTTVDAGFWKPASLGDYVWVDTNNDGEQNDGATGMNGVTVNLYTGAGVFVATTVTADNAGNPGYYLFNNLMPGDYKVEFIKPAGYAFAKQDQGADGSDSDADTTSGLTIVTTLESGENDLSWDAGLVQLASLGDRLWIDSNGNGQQDDGATGIAGRTVTLIGGGADGVIGTGGDDTSATTVTGADGYYNFSGLNVGEEYQVQFGDIPSGMVFTGQNIGADVSDSDADTTTGKTQIVTLASGEHNPTLDAGVYAPVAIGDKVWEDKNADGKQDGNEPGIDGVTVRLYNCVTNQLVATTVTANGGTYLFDGLAPGTYHVVFETPNGFVETTANVGGDAGDSDAVGGVTGCYTLPSGTTDTTVDAGFWKPASLGDYVWVDTNNDGEQNDGATGMNGVTVNLYTGAGVFVATTVTADNAGNPGYYLFNNLMPGDYKVEFIKPAGYAFAKQDQGADGSDSDADTTSGLTIVTTLESGENDLSWDAGLVQLASLGDRLWIDSNGNGQQDDGATGIAGRTVTLIGGGADGVIGTGGDDTSATTVTGADGYYNFSGLNVGEEYQVQFGDIPSGMVFTGQNIGADVSDSDADTTTGKTQIVTLASGEHNPTLDAGVYAPVAIGDKVWEDKNADGKQDGNEPGIDGVTVRLYNCVTNQLVATTVTANGGTYLFDGLAPGTYHVVFETPNGFVETTANVGGDAGDSDAVGGVTGCYTLPSGTTDTTVDAGFWKPASLGDYVWHDVDRDGVQDGNEVGIAGVTVRLLDCNNNNALVDTETTDASGYYNFTDLKPGNYKVEFVTPSGYVLTTQDAVVANDESDSDAGANGLTGCYTVSSGDAITSVDAGMYMPGVGIDIEKYVRGRYIDETGGGEGLTPGFWKTHSSYGPAPLAGWPETGYSPDDSYESVFGVSIAGSNPTLLEALGMNGGGMNALMRHSAAALLNASNPNVDYEYSKPQVISMTQGAFSSGVYDATKNLFEAQNELGADLNTPAGGGTVIETPDYDADTPTGPLIPVGGQAIFTYVVTNTGETELSNVQVSDDRIANLTYVGGDTDNDGRLDVSETWTYTATETVVPGTQYVNIGTATGTDAATGRQVDDSDAAHYITSGLTASLGDRVWLDTNANGKQDDGENGVVGVTVNLLNSAGNVINSATTDTNGNYLFANLSPGDYAIQVVAPNGYLLTGKDQGADDGKDSDVDQNTGKSVLTTITAGENDLSWDAGLVIPAKASIGDRVWLDCDADGIQDGNEIGVAGVTVNLLNSSGAVITSTTTDYLGNYLFDDLTAGDYAIQVVKPNGYSFTAKDQGADDSKDSDVDTTTGKTVVTTLSPGENDMSWDAGLTTVGTCLDLELTGGANSGNSAGNIRTYTMNGLSVNASAFSRTDSGGTWATAYLASYSGGLGVTDTSEDGATPNHAVDNVGGRDNFILLEFNKTVLLDKAFLGWVSGDSDIQVWIGNFNNPYNSHLSLSDAVLTSMGFMEVNTTTLSSTRWADLNAGDYAGNTIVIAADTTDTSPEDFFKLQTLSICTPSCGLTASIGDKVWLDSDCDGVQDATEAGVAGVTVKLLNAAGTVLATTTTNSAGEYLFSDLEPGDYAIQVVAPTGYTFTGKDLGGNDATDSDVDTSTGKTIVTTLSGGENDMTWDAGLKLVPTKASIGNKVWHDKDYDGIQDSNEAGIANVTVKLLNSAGTVLKTTTTNSVGEYLFSNLTPGDYKVQVVKPSGYYTTKQDQGSNNDVDSDVSSSGYTVLTNLVAGENDMSWDAGLYMKASVGDKVWDDMNHNNLQDSNEPGIANIKVVLKTSSGTTVATTYTDSSGNYKFSNLNPGDYYLVFDKTNVQHYNYGQWNNMSNWKWAVKDVGSNNAIDSDVTGNAISTTNVTQSSVFNLESGENDMSWDAGITPIAIDLNGDGLQTVSRANSNGSFDLLGNGKPIQSGWLSGEDGFLAVDANSNGVIDDINELFGGVNKGDGYAKLAAYDSNGDGMVDASDAAFADLRIWKDVDGDHQTDAGELLTLTEAGVASLSLNYQVLPLMDGNGNLHLERGSATLADGSSADMTDIYFGISAADAIDAGIELPSLGNLLGDDSSLDGLLAGLGGDAAAATVMAANAEVYDSAAFDGMAQLAAMFEEQAAACCA